jgi:hypothetical protein
VSPSRGGNEKKTHTMRLYRELPTLFTIRLGLNLF